MKDLSAGEKKLPVIIVLNRKYLSENMQQGFKVGVTSFAMKIAHCLKNKHSLAGILFYKRDDNLHSVRTVEENIVEFNTVTLHFNFAMPDRQLTEALRVGFMKLTAGHASLSTPLVYYQTDTLLGYHPDNIPCCVTHHGPFVDDFIANYSYAEAACAFESEEKVRLLQVQQRKGIAALRQNNYLALAHSDVQRRFLQKQGVKQENIIKIVPPIALSQPKNPIELHADILRFTDLTPHQVLLFSAVARIDYFKNIDVLIAASLRLLEKGLPLKIVIAGDEPQHLTRRARLRAAIPERYQSRFLITAKFSQDELFTFFRRMRRKAIFVCTSRYETLGITPLEAAYQGVCTLIPHSSLVEASAYFPTVAKFRYNTQSLAERITHCYRTRTFSDRRVQRYVRSRISPARLEDSFLDTLEKVSAHYLNG